MNQRLIPSPEDPIEELQFQMARTHGELVKLAEAFSAASGDVRVSPQRSRIFMDDLRVVDDDISDLAATLAASPPVKGVSS